MENGLSSWNKAMNWYNNMMVKSILLKSYHDGQRVCREGGVIGTNVVRFLNFSSFKSLEYVYGTFIAPRHYGLYRSIELLNMPLVPFDREQHTKAMKEFTKNFSKYMFGYDFCIDIDCGDLAESMKHSTKIKELYDEYKIPYSLKFSGSRGFHFVIPWEYIKEYVKTPSRMLNSSSTLAEKIAKHLDIPFVIGKGIDKNLYSLRQLWRTEYSIHQKTHLVALPLSDSQFDNFTPQICEPENVLKNVKLITGRDSNGRIVNRDDLLRNKESNNLKKFLEEFLPEVPSGKVGRVPTPKVLDYGKDVC